MKVLKNLYFSENIKNKQLILNLISNKTSVCGIYLICFSKDSSNLFEIFESKQFFKNFDKNKNWILVGLASGKKDAFLIIEKIFKNIFLRKNVSVKNFIQNIYINFYE